MTDVSTYLSTCHINILYFLKALSLEDVGLVSVTVSFIVVCINTFLNMGVFKTMFIIASSVSINKMRMKY